MRGLPAAFAIAMSMCAGWPVAANASDKEQDGLRKIAWAYGRCVVRKHHGKASEAVLAAVTNQEIITRLAQTIDAACLEGAAGPSNDMHFPNDTYQYMLADALVNADFATAGPTSFVDRLPLAQPALLDAAQREKLLAGTKGGEREAKRKGLERYNSLAWLSRFGECVVRVDPVNARYWILTPPDQPEEVSRISVMQPAFNACLSQGSVHFDRINLRGVVAMNYYRLAMATVVPGAGGHS